MKNTSKASIVLGILGILAGIWVQYQLFDGYQYASVKTKAVYGLRHLSYLVYLVLGGSALVMAIFSLFSKEKLKVLGLIFLLAIGSILLLILPIWRSFI